MARKNRMSRRDFLRSAAALGGGLIASQFLSGCQPQAAPGEYKRGLKKNAKLKAKNRRRKLRTSGLPH